MTEKIRWGILATGGIAAYFTEDLLQLSDAEVLAVGSRAPETAEAFASRYGIPRAYGSYEELAADPEVDIVYVATPHSGHLAASRLCLEAGRAVLCEKPVTLNAADARSLIDLARERGRFFMEAMWMRCNPAILRMLEVIDAGAIGSVLSLQADFGLAGPVEPLHRLRNPDLGGGALLDLGVYPISFAHMVLGAPSAITAWSRLSPEGVDENSGVLLGYDSGALATLSCGMLAESACLASVSGTDGWIELPHNFYRPDG